MLRATREDDVAAKACGVHSVRVRLIAFVLSAALVGAGGGLYAQFLGILTVDTFYLSLSFITIAMLVVGGMGSLTGAVSGVIVVTVIVQLLRFGEHGVTLGSTQLKMPESSSELGLGVLLALILIFRPNGVSGGRELTLIAAPKGAPQETASGGGRANPPERLQRRRVEKPVMNDPRPDNPFAAGAAYIDGRYMPIGEAAIPITDWGYRRSDVTYDVVGVWEGNFFRLDDHIRRFRPSMRKFRFEPRESDEEIKAILNRCVALSGLRNAYVAMDCLRGRPAPGMPYHPVHARNYIAAFAIPWVWVMSPEVQERGGHLIIAETVRIPPDSVDPTAKNFHWADLTRGQFEALDRGADFALLLDSEGNVTEGPGFNVFFVIDGVVVDAGRRRAGGDHAQVGHRDLQGPRHPRQGGQGLGSGGP